MHYTRLTALRGAVLLAAGFIVVRVLYRVVFGGANGSGILLLDPPRVRLSGPFEHIVLFGPVTTGGLGIAALSALPFAALVLVIGLLSAVVDIRALLTRGATRGPIRTVSRALVVAWATLPALLDSVRHVRVARELRAERGPASLIVPVLEQTVERAIALGASMEVRGFAATRTAEPDCEHPVTMADASLGYDESWTLEGVDLDVTAGTLTLVTGATGSGKSTLLHAMSGLLQHVSGGVQRGTITVAGVDRLAVPPRETAGFVGVVSQSVRLSFVAATVAQEIGFTLATRGVAPAIVAARAAETAAHVGISHLLEREVAALSAGEACLVAIAAALVERPVLLLADEPLADLDADARIRVIGVLERLAHEAGVCVVVAEHNVHDWADLPDRRLEIRHGRVTRGSAPPPRLSPQRASAQVSGDTVAVAHGITVRHGDRIAVDDVSLSLAAGELVALRGPNGAGKSTLLHALARPRERGTVHVDGVDVGGTSRWQRRRSVSLVPEASDDLLFASSVAEECQRADRRARGADTAALFARLLGSAGGSLSRAMLEQHPRDLSAGERLCLVFAIQLSAGPRVLLVDEPSRGLDEAARRLVGTVLLEVAAAGAAVVVATHDDAFAQTYATRIVTMSAGRLDVPVGAPR